MGRVVAILAGIFAAVALTLACVSWTAKRSGSTVLAATQEGWETEPGLIKFTDGSAGYGPFYYGDTRLYGARGQGRDGAEQPWPKYDTYERADVNAAKEHITKNWKAGYVKDFRSYFPEGARSGMEIPDPVEAGYWPFLTQDGVIAQGDAGGTGKALREWMVENAKPVDPLPVRTATAADELNGYLAAEEDGAGYTNTLRYWTDPNGWDGDDDAPPELKRGAGLRREVDAMLDEDDASQGDVQEEEDGDEGQAGVLGSGNVGSIEADDAPDYAESPP